MMWPRPNSARLSLNGLELLHRDNVWSPEKAEAAFKSQLLWPMQTMLKSQAILYNATT